MANTSKKANTIEHTFRKLNRITTIDEINSLKWDKNMPIPPRGCSVYWAQFVAEGNIGDSVTVHSFSQTMSLRNAAQNVGLDITVRFDNETTGYRCWLVNAKK